MGQDLYYLIGYLILEPVTWLPRELIAPRSSIEFSEAHDRRPTLLSVSPVAVFASVRLAVGFLVDHQFRILCMGSC